MTTKNKTSKTAKNIIGKSARTAEKKATSSAAKAPLTEAAAKRIEKLNGVTPAAPAIPSGETPAVTTTKSTEAKPAKKATDGMVEPRKAKTDWWQVVDAEIGLWRFIYEKQNGFYSVRRVDGKRERISLRTKDEDEARKTLKKLKAANYDKSVIKVEKVKPIDTVRPAAQS